MNDITLDQLLHRLDNGERTFLDGDYDKELDELLTLQVISVRRTNWDKNKGFSRTEVVRYVPLPSVRVLEPYRALRNPINDGWTDSGWNNQMSLLKSACTRVAFELLKQERLLQEEAIDDTGYRTSDT